MDTIPMPVMNEDEAEKLLLEKAVETSRSDPQPNIPHEVIQAKLIKKMEKLKVRIAALTEK
jgi:hypothetical protein